MSAAPKENNAYTHLTDLFAEMTALADGEPERERLRTQIIESSLPIADNIAARYRGRGQSHEDLVQVARLGLVNAVDRFDLGKGRDFLSFAVPTMMGEVRRYFRDKGWGVRVPRSLQENYLALSTAHTSLTQSFGREPTTFELAHEIGVELSEVGQIAAAGDSYQAASLEATTVGDGRSIGDTLGDFDAALDGIDNHETLRPALLALPERERIILLYRFFGGLTQAEIAEKVGISQMHVSRLLTQSLKTLRAELGNSAEPCSQALPFQIPTLTRGHIRNDDADVWNAPPTGRLWSVRRTMHPHSGPADPSDTRRARLPWTGGRVGCVDSCSDSVELGTDQPAKFIVTDTVVPERNCIHRDAVDGHLADRTDHRIILTARDHPTRSEHLLDHRRSIKSFTAAVHMNAHVLVPHRYEPVHRILLCPAEIHAPRSPLGKCFH